MRENMNTNEGIDRKLSGGGYKLNNNNLDDNEVDIRNLEELFYGVPTLSKDEEKEIDEMIASESGFLCPVTYIPFFFFYGLFHLFVYLTDVWLDGGFILHYRKINERKRENAIRIGRIYIGKTACFIFVICLSVILTGGIVYAAVQNYIKSIKVNDMGDYSEVEIECNDVPATSKTGEFYYYEPVWVPDGYCKTSENKYDMTYVISYKEADFERYINYHQYLPGVKFYYSAENGKIEKVSFGKYSGEYIETYDANYLIVTDGTYIYSLSAESVYKDDLIKMLDNK